MPQNTQFFMDDVSILQGQDIEKGYTDFMGKKSIFRRASSFLARKIAFKTYKIDLTPPLVSFVFDDIPVSAYSIAAPMLEEAGMRGTFYIATALCRTYSAGSQKSSLEDIMNLAANGHEIALHTHQHLPVFSYDKDGLIEDIYKNHKILSKYMPHVTYNLAAPYGAMSIFHKFSLRNKLRSIRSILIGINSKQCDPFCLKVLNLDGHNLSDEKILSYLELAKEQKAWVIFMSHNIAESQSYITTSKARLKLMIETTQGLGFKTATVDKALTLIGVPDVKEGLSYA